VAERDYEPEPDDERRRRRFVDLLMVEVETILAGKGDEALRSKIRKTIESHYPSETVQALLQGLLPTLARSEFDRWVSEYVLRMEAVQKYLRLEA
jgi:hypothetical protein